MIDRSSREGWQESTLEKLIAGQCEEKGRPQFSLPRADKEEGGILLQRTLEVRLSALGIARKLLTLPLNPAPPHSQARSQGQDALAPRPSPIPRLKRTIFASGQTAENLAWADLLRSLTALSKGQFTVCSDTHWEIGGVRKTDLLTTTPPKSSQGGTPRMPSLQGIQNLREQAYKARDLGKDCKMHLVQSQDIIPRSPLTQTPGSNSRDGGAGSLLYPPSPPSVSSLSSPGSHPEPPPTPQVLSVPSSRITQNTRLSLRACPPQVL